MQVMEDAAPPVLEQEAQRSETLHGTATVLSCLRDGWEDWIQAVAWTAKALQDRSRNRPTMKFSDHFSSHAEQYARARPGYPAEMFEWLAAQCVARECAWDAGCGNGQASLALAAHFAHVVGTDPSAEQIAHTAPAANIEYRVEPAEDPSLQPGSVDLIVVAQAFHWFDIDRFHAAAQRILRPRGLIAIWAYGLCHTEAAVDEIFMHLYDGILGAYWPPERRFVENGYADLAFPYVPVEAPGFEMTCAWSLEAYLAYLGSWSATQRYIRANRTDPVASVRDAFARAWGDPERVRTVRWPLALRVGRCLPRSKPCVDG